MKPLQYTDDEVPNLVSDIVKNCEEHLATET
jgi:hypothetical protein